MGGQAETESQILTQQILIDREQAQVFLDSAAGELRWRAAGRDRCLTVESEVLGLETEGARITVRAFVASPESESFCLPSTSDQRVRKDFVLEMPSRDSAILWSQRLKDCIDSLGRPKRLFIIVNPFGGKRRATSIFGSALKPLLEAAGILYTLQETSHRLHAQEIAQKIDLTQYDGIVCVSGDGVLVEVVNGLLQREDWHAAIKMPLGIVPAGTGNGMAKSLLDSVGELYSASNAALAIVRGYKRSLDVASISQGDARFFSVLMLTWGFMADVDLESERYRWMGSARLGFYDSCKLHWDLLDIGFKLHLEQGEQETQRSLLRIINLRRYHGCVQFVPAPGYEVYGEPVNQNDCKSNELSKQANMDDIRVQQCGYQGPTTRLENLEWRSINGPFVLVLVNNVPWTVEDVLSAPEAKFSDGYLDMTIIKDCPKAFLLMLLLNLEDGSHVKSKYIMYLKVKAFILEPGHCVGNPRKGGIIDSDGEIIARGEGTSVCHQQGDPMVYGPPIQVTVDKALATIFSPR